MGFELPELFSHPIFVSLSVEGIKFLGHYIMTKKTAERCKTLWEKCFKKNSQKIESLSEERKIKILKYLVLASEDEDFNLKEKGYLLDLEKIINEKNYIPIFNKISWKDLEYFQFLGNNYNEIMKDKDFQNTLENQYNIYPYVFPTVLWVLNNQKAYQKMINNQLCPIKIEDFKKTSFLDFLIKRSYLINPNIDIPEKNIRQNDNVLEEIIRLLLSAFKIDEANDYMLFWFDKIEQLELIKLANTPFYNKQGYLKPFTIDNTVLLVTKKGQKILKLLNEESSTE